MQTKSIDSVCYLPSYITFEMSTYRVSSAIYVAWRNAVQSITTKTLDFHIHYNSILAKMTRCRALHFSALDTTHAYIQTKIKFGPKWGHKTEVDGA